MKQTISATIEKELADWIEYQLKDSSRYRNKSHLIEIAIEMLKRQKAK